MTALATNLRRNLGTYRPRQVSRFASVEPDRDGTPEQVNAWFREEIYARNRHIHEIKSDRFYVEGSDDDESHINMIKREVAELLEEWEEYLRLYGR